MATPLHLLRALGLAAIALFGASSGHAIVQPQSEQNKSPVQVASNAVTEEQKKAVLESVQSTLNRRAFVHGIDFSRWSQMSESHRDAFDRARTPAEFARAVTQSLRGFGISHLRLSPPAAPRQPEGGGPSSFVHLRAEGPETLRWLDDSTAVIRIPSFDDDVYSRDNVRELMAQAREKAQILVVDLRGNGGGAVRNMQHFLGFVLPDNTAVGVYVGRGAVREFERREGRPPADSAEVASQAERKFRIRASSDGVFKGKLAVLISRGSASASEIIAAALRDCANAPIVGQPSAGMVLLSTHLKVGGGFELQFPTSDYITISGVRLEGNPIKPHLIVPRNRRGAADVAPDEAVRLVREGL